MARSLEGKVAIVTGGNAGIGKATARLFAAEGARTIVCARRVEEGEETVNEIVAAGGIASFVQADVSRSADVKALVDETVSRYGGGSIVNMSSIYGLLASHLQMPAYTASKHGVIGLTKSGARDYANDNIRVNAICPAYIHTAMVDGPMSEDAELAETVMGLHPIGRLGTVEEIAEAVLWLSSDKSSFVTGHSLAADGGVTLG